jgi:hypothetical protein
MHLGYRYDSTAVLDAVVELPSLEHVEEDLDGSPGCRLPHRWLTRGGERISSLDLVDFRFTLLAGPQGGAWLEALENVTKRLGVPVDGHRVGGGSETEDADGAWPAGTGIEDSGALLVRPDGFVGWRACSVDGNPADLLKRALSALLQRADAFS